MQKYRAGFTDPMGSYIEDSEGKTVFGWGTAKPTDGLAGYKTGCIFLDTDASAGAQIFVNEGTDASCDFNSPMPHGAALTTQLTSITIADAAGTPDYALSALTTTSPYGLATQAEAITLLYVIQNLQVRMAEVEARLQAAGIVA